VLGRKAVEEVLRQMGVLETGDTLANALPQVRNKRIYQFFNPLFFAVRVNFVMRLHAQHICFVPVCEDILVPMDMIPEDKEDRGMVLGLSSRFYQLEVWTFKQCPIDV
jgi:hypothetical protein